MIISEQEQQWIQAARAQVERIDLRDLIASMTSIPSPTGQEGELARWLAEEMAGRGLDGFYQPMDAEQGNAVGRLRGDGTGADLLLYAPIDTLTVGTEEEDLPWAGTELRRDMRAEGLIEGDYVVGLGASNPKGHGAALIAAVSAVRAAGVPLRGDVIVGLGAGGMPTNRRPGAARYNAGQGNGCSFMLEQGVWADYALIAKPGWAVHWEEVGLCWFEVDRPRHLQLRRQPAPHAVPQRHRRRRHGGGGARAVLRAVRRRAHPGAGRAAGQHRRDRGRLDAHPLAVARRVPAAGGPAARP